MMSVEVATDFSAQDFAREMQADPSEIDTLEAFRDMIAAGNERMNLVGPTALESFWRRHAFDSAQLLHVEQSAQVWADVGAGAGFPGVVLAILLKRRPNSRVHLIESMAKRVRFLESVAEVLDLPVSIHHGRAEDVEAIPGLDVITARACAPLPRLFGYTQQFFRKGARAAFLKGRAVESELTEARRSWSFDADLNPSRSDPSGYVVRVERLAPRGG